MPFGTVQVGLATSRYDRRLQLRRRLVGFAVDDVAMIDMLAVAPIIEERSPRC